jgi:nucleoside phosphorylase
MSSLTECAGAQGARCRFGIVTALPKEFAAMRAMLDEPQAHAVDGDPNDYVIGSIPAFDGSGEHRVVVTLLKKAGNNPASAAAVNLLRSFPSTEDVLMVGIAGGIPNPAHPDKHVRLGDIVVSNEYGVLQYDNVKMMEGAPELRGTSSPPSAALLGKTRILEAGRLEGRCPWEKHIQRARRLKGAARPRPSTDRLYSSDDPSLEIAHPPDPDRRRGKPKVHYGRVGSANVLLRNPKLRDALRDQHDARAIEMEGSGIADGTWEFGQSYMLIRGISDYCDSHKSDTWQGYAAVVAAAYARALIESFPAKGDPAKAQAVTDARKKRDEARVKKGGARRLLYLANITPPEPNFVGRNEYLNTITEWYKNPDVHIGALISWGGEGKSSIARKRYDSLGETSIKPDGIFWWGFYRNNNLDRFLNSLLGYLVHGRINLDEMKSAWAKVDKINELIQQAEYLIILDGLEEMQKGEERGPEFGCMSHRELSAILTSLLDSKAKGLCLITTRYPLTDIENWKGASYQAKDVESLSIEDGRLLFEKIGVEGDQNDIDAVIKEYNGHALSLTLLAKYLVEDFKGDIIKTKEIPPFHSDREAGGKAHRILLWYAQQLSKEQLAFMKIFSLFRMAVNDRDFEGVFREEMETSINKPLRDMTLFSFKRMVDNLYDRRLITKEQDDTYTAHPLIKNYFESIFEEDDKKLCHRKIYQYINTYAPEKPETFEEMQPLFEQVYHGCKARMYDESFDDIYYKKVQRGQEFF